MTAAARPIAMRDLAGEYRSIKQEIDDAILGVLESGEFERGEEIWPL